MDSFLKAFILFCGAVLGGLAVFLIKKDSRRTLKLVLSFSGAFLFAVTVLHLMPDVYYTQDPYIGLFVLAGFAFQIILEQFSRGVEHGHLHTREQALPYGIMISLCLHAFLEAMPLSHHEHEHNQLLWGITIHHIPASFALSSILLQSSLGKPRIIALVLLFALMSPAGLLFSQTLTHHALGYAARYADYIMAIVIGIFLHISTTILFESSEDHRFKAYKLLAILSGTGIALLFYFLE